MIEVELQKFIKVWNSSALLRDSDQNAELALRQNALTTNSGKYQIVKRFLLHQ